MTEEDRIKDQARSEQEDEAQAFQQARELVLALANTISALKIFPAHHSSAIHFRRDFISRLKAFLDRFQKLELEVGEFAFYYQGKPVYQDEISSKSLPFFFYKDGLRVLALYQGMDEQEIGEFLELVRTESAKPAEESDLVNALWLKDLANVQYYAPEEFIENRILEERAESLNKKGLQIIPQELANRVVEIKVDRQKIFSGQVELRPEEKQALESFQDQEFPDLPESWQQTPAGNLAADAEFRRGRRKAGTNSWPGESSRQPARKSDSQPGRNGHPEPADRTKPPALARGRICQPDDGNPGPGKRPGAIPG